MSASQINFHNWKSFVFFFNLEPHLFTEKHLHYRVTLKVFFFLKWSSKNRMILKVDKLYRIKKANEQLVLPKCLQIKVLNLGHSELSVRYIGQTKTLHRIVSQFYWSCQYLDIGDLTQVSVKIPRN